MKYYFIERILRKDAEHHLIHTAACCELPDADLLYPLGIHSFHERALEKGARLYTPTKACPLCCDPA